MASIESLPPDQRAVLELVLRRGRSYDEIAQLLSIDRAGVRQRALSALDALGPDAGVPAERRALITDYLLGSLPPRVTEQVRERLAQSPGERAWARVIAAELEPIASRPLPDIPVAGETATTATAPPAAPEREAPRPPGAPPPAEAPKERAKRRPFRLTRRRREPRAQLGPTPPVEAGRQRPASRRGGMLVLAAAAVIVLAIVLSVALTGGGNGNSSPGPGAASTPTTTSTPTTPTTSTTSSTPTTSTTPPGQLIAQINLSAPSGSEPKGIADVLRAGSKQAVYIVAQGLKPNTKSDAYAVWLYNSATDSHLLGFVNPGVGAAGRLQTEGVLPANASHYQKLLVTLETQGNPKSPGQIILEGTLRGLS